MIQRNSLTKNSKKIVVTINGVGIFYVTAINGDQARVRPFSSVTEFEGNAYICTNNTKDVYKQIVANTQIEISGMGKDGSWIRIVAKAVRDDRDEARSAMLADPTGPSKLYTIGDGIFEVLKLEVISAKRYSFTNDPENIA